MRSWIQKLLLRHRFRVLHRSKFPKGDLVSSLLNMAERGFDAKHIVDVGANHGKWSRKAAWVYPQATFTLIEPQQEMKPFLDRFCEEHPRAEWINAGAADQMGEQLLTVHPDTVSTTFTMSERSAKASGFECRSVPVVTLDHVAQNVIHAIPDIVKIDAEGFECKILRGAQSLVGKTEVFLLEVPFVEPPENWNSFAEIIAFMAERQYVPYDFTSFQKRPYDGALGLCEIAFARQQGILRNFGGWSKAA